MSNKKNRNKNRIAGVAQAWFKKGQKWWFVGKEK